MKIAAFVAACLVQVASGQDAARSARPHPTYWWEDRVFYQVFPRSFADSTKGSLAHDGIGDLRGLIERLDYLNDGNPETTTDLGIGGLWLTPFYPSPSYHGYDITDYHDVHPQLGTIDDFKTLMAESHKRGIKVLVDLVMNHCSSKHEWFTKATDPRSPFHDWFIWSDKDPGWKGPWNQRVWHSLPAPAPLATERYYYGLFSPTMPDLNFRNPAVTDAMNEITRAWISAYGADGIRLDAIRHLIEEGQVQQNTPATHAWLRDWYLNLKGVNIDALSIGEVWADSEQAASYVGEKMDMVFEFALADAMIASARSGDKEALIKAQSKVLSLYPSNQYGRFLSNHDQTRVMTQLKGDASAMKAAAMLLLLGPGVPFIYYGEELGMTGDKPDENLRTPMLWSDAAHAGFSSHQPWAPVAPAFPTLNVETQTRDAGSLLNTYRRLIHLRNSNPALAAGDTWLIETEQSSVVAYLRHRVTRFGPRSTESRPRIDSVLILVNISGKPVEKCTIALATSPLRGTLVGKDALGSATIDNLKISDTGGFENVNVSLLAPHSAAVFILKSE